ncbi:probable cytochrome P450 304a1 [Condylostylus longicornis]|uniref:probable cytochrome P450 304a1 n=1 Tax=Condylostylus longicornis TaxID=2530218 RepID=UPI00244E5AC9|nr:probable cytochrome P450 304a1 [Condylostylus longicornis]
MVSVIILSLFAISVVYFFYKYGTDKPYKYPPGPPKIPLFGSYLFLLLCDWKRTSRGAMMLSKLYKSDIIGLFLGEFHTVVVNSYDGIKEMFSRPEFDGKPDVMAARLRDPHYGRTGIFFNDGPIWKEQRRFILRYLRDYGFGRRFDSVEQFINDELSYLINLIKTGPKYSHEKEFFPEKGKVLCPYFMNSCSLSSFLYICFNERIPQNDRKIFNELIKDSIIFNKTGDPYGLLLSIMPWIRFIFPNLSSFKPLRETSKGLYIFIKDLIDKNMKTYKENEERNFIDLYVKEMKKMENQGVNNSSFYYDQFVLSIVDFAFPANLAITVQLSLMFQWFILRPDILKNIQNEIDNVVGHSRLPTLDDRKNLPYTEAALRECMRIESLTPSGFPHKALVDTEFKGYFIPKDTLMIPGIYAFHMDKNIWSDPDVFKPERFLDSNGELCLSKDKTLPFGAGKRLCAGETFARNMMFLILTAICQNFNVILRPEQSLPDMTKAFNGISIVPPDFWLYLEERTI